MIKRPNNKKTNIVTEYMTFFVIITFSAVIMSMTLALITYKTYNRSNKHLLQIKTNAISISIQDILDAYEWQVRGIANQISEHNQNLNKINNILINTKRFNIIMDQHQFVNWHNLYWVNNKDYALINSKSGIYQNIQKIPHYYEIFNAKKEKWKLLISSKSPYYKNDYKLLTTTFGITDKSGQYIGAIASSIELNSIKSLIMDTVNNKNEKYKYFIILNKQGEVVLQSKHSKINESSFLKQISEIFYNQDDEGYLKKGPLENGIKYSYYKKSDKYPFIIMVGYNHNLHIKDLTQSILSTIYPALIISACLLLILLIFYKRIIRPIKILATTTRRIISGDYANNTMPKNIKSPEVYDLATGLLRIKQQRKKLEKYNYELFVTKNKLEDAINTIKKSDLTKSQISKQVRAEVNKNSSNALKMLHMLKYNIGSNNANFDKDLNIILVKTIEQELSNIVNFVTNELKREYINIRYIMEKSILSQGKEIKMKNIQLNVKYGPHLPQKIYADQIRMVQVISSILNKSIEALPENGSINIEIRSETINNKKYLSIKIQDNGLGIKEYVTNSKKYEEEGLSSINLSINSVEELIKLHKGKIEYNNNLNKKSIITIKIPYIEAEKVTSQKKIAEEKKSDNVVYLDFKNKKDSTNK